MDYKKFAKLISVFLGLAMAFSSHLINYPTYVDAEFNLSQGKSKRKELEDKKNALKQSLESNENKILTQEMHKAELEKQKKELHGQILELKRKIVALNNEVAELEKKINQKSAEIDLKVEILKQRIRALEKVGEFSFLDCILTSDNISELYEKAKIIQMVARHDNGLIDAIESDIIEVQNHKNMLLEKRGQIEDEEAVATLRLKEYDEMVKLSNELTVDLKIQQKYTKEDIDENTEERQALDEQFRAYYEEQRRLEEERLARERAKKAAEKKAREERIAKQKADYEIAVVKAKENGQSIPEPPKEEPEVAEEPEYVVGEFAWPVPGFDWISSPFGELRGGGSRHNGIDIAGAGIYGKSIVAAQDGVVKEVYSGCRHDYGKSYSTNCRCGYGYGNYVLIEHGGGEYVTRYAHMCEILVVLGEKVKKGSTVGYVGTTGYSTGPHLHYEVMHWGEKIDPQSKY